MCVSIVDITYRVLQDGGMTETQTFITTSEVAARVRVDSSTVRRWAIEGTLPAHITPGGHYRFRPEDVDALLSREVAA